MEHLWWWDFQIFHIVSFFLYHVFYSKGKSTKYPLGIDIYPILPVWYFYFHFCAINRILPCLQTPPNLSQAGWHHAALASPLLPTRRSNWRHIPPHLRPHLLPPPLKAVTQASGRVEASCFCWLQRTSEVMILKRKAESGLHVTYSRNCQNGGATCNAVNKWCELGCVESWRFGRNLTGHLI